MSIIILNKMIRKVTIYMLLKRGNVELNPGPKIQNVRQRSIDIVTYNCNGLVNRNKLKRVMAKADVIARNGGIVMLQETHVTNERGSKVDR
jgi:hypothetical protein